MKTKWLQRLVLLGLCQIQIAGALAYEFEVKGTVRMLTNGSLAISHPFEVYVQDCRWAVFKFPNGSTKGNFMEISDDGNNIYKLSHLETSPADFATNGFLQSIEYGGPGEIYPAGFPHQIPDTEVITLFYAYASSCYLDAHTNNVVGSLPFGFSGFPGFHSYRHYQYDEGYAKITRNWSPLRLPKHMVFLIPFQYATNAIFTASVFTNIADVTIPLSVEVSNATLKYEFHATQISGKCPLKSFKPTLTRTPYIMDYRGSGLGNMKAVTNGWPE